MSVVVNPIPVTPAPTIEPTGTPDSTTAILATDTPTDSPQPVDMPTPIASPQNGDSTFRNLAIGITSIGVFVVGSVLVFQKIKKKNF